MSIKRPEMLLGRAVALDAAKRARRSLEKLLGDDDFFSTDLNHGELKWGVQVNRTMLELGCFSLRTNPSLKHGLMIDRQVDLAHPPVTTEGIELLDAIAALSIPKPKRVR